MITLVLWIYVIDCRVYYHNKVDYDLCSVGASQRARGQERSDREGAGERG